MRMAVVMVMMGMVMMLMGMLMIMIVMMMMVIVFTSGHGGCEADRYISSLVAKSRHDSTCASPSIPLGPSRWVALQGMYIVYHSPNVWHRCLFLGP